MAQWAGGRRRGAQLAVAVAFLAVVLAGAPAVAAACPSWSKVKGLRGSADTAFDATAIGSDNMGGTETVALSRSGSLRIAFPGRFPRSGSGFTSFFGATAGGTLYVDDSYRDAGSGYSTTGSQHATGPGVQDNFDNLATLVLRPKSCTYQLRFAFAIPTSSTGSWPTIPDAGAGGVAVTPVRHIPKNLKLFGTVQVPAFYDGCSSSRTHGCYEFGGYRGDNEWAQEFDMLKACGSVVASSCNHQGQEGTATISWSLAPYNPHPKPKKKKGH